MRNVNCRQEKMKMEINETVKHRNKGSRFLNVCKINVKKAKKKKSKKKTKKNR